MTSRRGAVGRRMAALKIKDFGTVPISIRADASRDAIINYSEDGDIESGMVDLLADVMHLCKHDNLDFWQALITAKNHFDTETKIEGGENE